MARKKYYQPAVSKQGASPAPATDESAVSQLSKRREQASRELESAIRDFHKAEARVRQLNAEIDRLSAEIDKLEPPPKAAEVIQTYLQNEIDLRVKRVRENGGPAPIDRALARNRSRGATRPQFPGK